MKVRGKDVGMLSFNELGVKPLVNELLIWRGDDGCWQRGIALDDQGILINITKHYKGTNYNKHGNDIPE